MKRQAFLGRHFQFCSMKFMLFFFLSSHVIQDVSPASIKSCELRASCSSECQYSTRKTVNPNSNATVGCSIMNKGPTQDLTREQVRKGSTQDFTWEQVRREIHGSNNVYDLVLQQQENPHCSCTHITLAHVSPAGTLDCEISAQKCQPPLESKTRTVTPKDSKVNLNCSIKNGGKVQDMTWQYLEKHLNASDAGLFVQHIDSKNRSQPRECFSIKYAIPVNRVSKASCPVDFYPDTREMEVKCTFKGWPRPRVVWYNPSNKQIINGSEGFYISEQLDREDTLLSLLRNADIQEKHRGAYKCTGMNNITNWSSKKSGYIDLNYRCLLPKAPKISSREVSVTAYSNVSLKCEVGVRPSDCWDNSLQWYFNNGSGELKFGEKYDIQERKTNTRCKKDFILTIVNVTEADEGMYKCQWLCDHDYPIFSRSSIIQLKVFPPSEEDSSTPSTQKITNSTSTDAVTA